MGNNPFAARALFMPKMKKSLRIACLLRVVSALFVLTGLVMYFVIHLNDEVRTYTYVKGVINEQSSYGQYESMFFTIFITAAVLVLASAPFDCYGALKASSRVRNVVVSLIMSAAVMISGLILIISNYSGNLYDNDPKYYLYDSPDKSRSIVICERSNFSDGYGDIYQAAFPPKTACATTASTALNGRLLRSRCPTATARTFTDLPWANMLILEKKSNERDL